MIKVCGKATAGKKRKRKQQRDASKSMSQTFSPQTAWGLSHAKGQRDCIFLRLFSTEQRGREGRSEAGNWAFQMNHLTRGIFSPNFVCASPRSYKVFFPAAFFPWKKTWEECWDDFFSRPGKLHDRRFTRWRIKKKMQQARQVKQQAYLGAAARYSRDHCSCCR